MIKVRWDDHCGKRCWFFQWIAGWQLRFLWAWSKNAWAKKWKHRLSFSLHLRWLWVCSASRQKGFLLTLRLTSLTCYEVRWALHQFWTKIWGWIIQCLFDLRLEARCRSHRRWRSERELGRCIFYRRRSFGQIGFWGFRPICNWLVFFWIRSFIGIFFQFTPLRYWDIAQGFRIWGFIVRSWRFGSMFGEGNWSSRLKIRINLLFPIFFNPTGTPVFLTLCSGFKGSRLIFFYLASFIDNSIALLSCVYSSFELPGFWIG